jgi:hypothetical protein
MDIQKLIEVCGEMSRRTGGGKFGSPGPIYTFCTENIGGYLAAMNGPGRTRALTLCASGDQALNLTLLGFNEVHCFDLNRLAKVWLEMKLAAIRALSRTEFLEFFLTGSENQILCEGKFRLFAGAMEDESREFFEFAYREFRGDGNAIYRSALFKHPPSGARRSEELNPYLRSEEDFELCKASLQRTSVTWRQADLMHLPGECGIMGSRFDAILLSNLADYAGALCPDRPDYLRAFAESLGSGVGKLLSRDGRIAAAYFYNHAAAEKSPRSLLDIGEKRRLAFGSLSGYVAEEHYFPGLMPDTQDGAVFLKPL